jgi:type I restriction enzyme R subunit
VTAHAYTEDQLLEQPTINLFAELGWKTVSAMEEKFGAGGTLGRETSGEAVLVPRLSAALEKLNPDLPAEAVTSALDELTRDRGAMTPRRMAPSGAIRFSIEIHTAGIRIG